MSDDIKTAEIQIKTFDGKVLKTSFSVSERDVPSRYDGNIYFDMAKNILEEVGVRIIRDVEERVPLADQDFLSFASLKEALRRGRS